MIVFFWTVPLLSSVIHCSNNPFDFSHQGMMLQRNINTFLPFRKSTPFHIIHCNLEITLTCAIIQSGVLMTETGIRASIVRDSWVFWLWCKLASIFFSQAHYCYFYVSYVWVGHSRYIQAQGYRKVFCLIWHWKILIQKQPEISLF